MAANGVFASTTPLLERRRKDEGFQTSPTVGSRVDRGFRAGLSQLVGCRSGVGGTSVGVESRFEGLADEATTIASAAGETPQIEPVARGKNGSGRRVGFS